MSTPARRLGRAPAWAMAGALLAGVAHAAPPASKADLALGEQLMRQHRCAECHMRHVGGDGSDIYRPDRRVNTPSALRSMVEQCNTQLNLQMFPDEVSAVAAVLQRDHYKFTPR